MIFWMIKKSSKASPGMILGPMPILGWCMAGIYLVLLTVIQLWYMQLVGGLVLPQVILLALSHPSPLDSLIPGLVYPVSIIYTRVLPLWCPLDTSDNPMLDGY